MIRCRKKAGLLLVLLGVPVGAAAQDPSGGAVRGRAVAGDTGEPLVSATAVVRSVADSAIVDGALTGAAGTFVIGGLRPGRYIVEVTYLGYTPGGTPMVTVTAVSDTIDVGTIRMAVDAIAVAGVEVEAEPSPVTFEADRTLYNVDDMPGASGGVATELLQSVPELQVNIDGSVSLRGSQPQIYINGRPAPIEGEALNIFLEQFPADRIERIEVIPNPSARYDAEGAGGIVNIVLKEDVDLGLNASLFASGGTRGSLGGGARVSYQRGPLTLFGGAFGRHSNRESASYDLRQNLLADPTTFLRQDSRSDRTGLFGGIDLSAELEVSDRLRIWSEGRVFRDGSESDETTTTTYLDAAREPTQRYDRVSASESEGLSADLATGFLYAFEPGEHELEVELEVEKGSDDAFERAEAATDGLEGVDDALPAELMFEDALENELETTFELDYTRPWGEDGRIEIGYEAEIVRTEDDRLRTFLPDADDATNTIENPTGFEHREWFNSLYLVASREIGDLGVQLGVRAERADTRFTIPTGEAFDNDYMSFFPSVNISYVVADGRQIQLSYGRRIRRPSSRILNPIDDSTDPLDRRIGNPFIEPQYTHSMSVETRWTGRLGTLRITPYYRQTTNDWARITRVDENGVATETWENVASSHSYGTSVTASISRTETWGGYISVSGRREVRDADNVARNYTGASLDLSARASLSAELTESFSMRTMLYYSPPRDVPEGRIGSRVRMHVGLRQRLLDDRASISVRLRDPFDLYDSSFETRDPRYLQIGGSEYSRRSAVIALSYSFGEPVDDDDDWPGEQR